MEDQSIKIPKTDAGRECGPHTQRYIVRRFRGPRLLQLWPEGTGRQRPCRKPSRSIPVIVCHPSAGLTLPCDAHLPPSNQLVKTNGPVVHFYLRNLVSIRLDEGVHPWHLHVISVANVANQAITSATPITRPSGSSSPTSNQSGH